MSQAGDVHVVPAGAGWAVEVHGRGRRGTYETQDRAIKVAREIAAENRTELLIRWTDRRSAPRRARGSVAA